MKKSIGLILVALAMLSLSHVSAETRLITVKSFGVSSVPIESPSGDGGTTVYSFEREFSGNMDIELAAPRVFNGKAFFAWDVAGGGGWITGSGTNDNFVYFSPLFDKTATATYRTGYTLSVIDGGGSGFYCSAYTLTITADQAPDGKAFDKWTGDTQYIADVNSSTTTLTMPSGNTTVTATYKDLPFLTVNYGSGSGYYVVGFNTTVCADVAERGYEFDQWTVVPSQYVSNLADATSSCTTFIMPAVNVALTATYKSDGSPAWWSIDPSSANHSGGTESSLFSVAQVLGADASWTATLSAETQGWVTLTPGYTSGIGGGEVRYSVDWNDTSEIRHGSIQVQNASFMISQQPTLAPVSLAGKVATVGDPAGDYAKIAYGGDGNYASIESSSGGSVAGAYEMVRTDADTLTVTQYTASAEIDVVVHYTFTSSTGGTVLNGSDSSPFTMEAAGDWAPQSLAGKVAEYRGDNDEPVKIAFRSDGSAPVQRSVTEDELATYTYAKTALNTGEGTINTNVQVDYTFVSSSNVVLTVVTDDVPPETNTMAMVVQNGTLFWLDVEQGTGDGAYAPGETASIIADAPADGYRFAAWTGSGAGSVTTPTTLTMPSQDIAIMATYEMIPPTWELDPDNIDNVPGSATSGSITLTQVHGPTNSPWTAAVVSGADWLSITSGTSGNGNGSVSYSVAANESGLYRFGEMLVAGERFTVYQNPLPPTMPSNPSPPNSATGVERDVTLSWAASDYALGYEVWFAKGSSELSKVASLSSTSYNTGLREAGVTFLWKVVATNEGGSATGGPWSFTTEDQPTPDETLGTSGIEWSHSGETEWFPTNLTTHFGVSGYVAQSGAIVDGESSVLEAMVVGPGTLDFWWKVSSETNDFLNLYLGTNMVDGIAGISPDWIQESVSVPDGVQVLSWKYEKNASVSNGLDCAWLDDVQWQGANRTTYPLNGFEGKWVCSYLWDDTAQEWIILNNPEVEPTQVVVKNIKPSQWYWLCVMEYDGANWNLAHGSWVMHLDEM